MIEIKNIYKSYSDTSVLKDVSFSVGKGEVVGLLGENGAGKTTLMRILMGYISYTSGEVFFDGKPVSRKSQAVTGYLPESNPLYLDMKVYEYLSFVAGVRFVLNKTKQIRDVVGRVYIEEKINETIGDLSKGYKQRVGLAAALISDPKVLILDEPSSGLDPNQAHQMKSLIKEIGKEKTIIFSSHILSEVEAVCERIVLIHDKTIAYDGIHAQEKSFKEVEVVIDASAEKVIGVFGNIEKIEKAFYLDEGRFLFGSSHKDLEKTIYQECVSRGWVLTEMKEQKSSLERLFKEITTKQQ